MRLKNLDILLPEHMFLPYEQFIHIWRLCYNIMCYISIFTLNDLSEFFNNKKYLSTTLLEMFGKVQNFYVTNVA